MDKKQNLIEKQEREAFEAAVNDEMIRLLIEEKNLCCPSDMFNLSQKERVFIGCGFPVGCTKKPTDECFMKLYRCQAEANVRSRGR